MPPPTSWWRLNLATLSSQQGTWAGINSSVAMMRRLIIVVCSVAAVSAHSERINHAGRILGPLQVPSVATQFNTPQADAILASMQVFPTTSAWNEDISHRPLLSNSAAMIAMIRSELAESRRNFRAFFEMNFVLVPNNQGLVPIDFVTYPGDSDPGPYPIPGIMPIELWPIGTDGQTLDQWQRDTFDWGGDRHGLVAQPGTGKLYETWQMKKLANNGWEASNGAKFDMNSNVLRPLGWTSGDAAGLAMFPALVKYDEVQRGQIEHAIRLVVKHTRKAYIYPATHYASVPETFDQNVPAMGQRLRLPASFQIPANWSQQSKCVAQALKKYGAIVADNGNFFQTSITPDDRWPEGCFDDLWNLDVNNFEVVQTTGATQGPRSANPPTANAGADKSALVNSPLSIQGVVGGGSSTLTVLWTKYSGPGAVTFGNASVAQTMATFGTAGTYTLMLKADDAIHTPAYDAVVVTVSSGGAISGLAMDPNPLDGGYPAVGNVTLALPAPSGGAKVWLSDSLTNLTTPANMTVAAGSTTGQFACQSSAVSTSINGTLTATYQGTQRSASVTLQPAPGISEMSLNPSSVTGGAVSVATVTLSRAASPGGAIVWLASSSPSATVPSKVVVPAGSNRATFSVVSHPVGVNTNVNVSASTPGSAMGVQLSVLPPALALMSVLPTTVQGGNPSVGTARLNGNAPAEGSVVSLFSNKAAASVPATLLVPAGLGRADFAISTQPVLTTTVVTISGKRLGVTRSATLTLTP